MYCPKCGSETLDDGKFCRACGADVSLVPVALTGRLPAGAAGVSAEAAKRLSNAVMNFVMSAAFLVVTFCVLLFMPGGEFWWFWLLIPTFALTGAGLQEYVRYRLTTGRPAGALPVAETTDPGRELPRRSFTDALPPASVTESTTRRLERERSEEGRR